MVIRLYYEKGEGGIVDLEHVYLWGENLSQKSRMGVSDDVQCLTSEHASDCGQYNMYLYNIKTYQLPLLE